MKSVIALALAGLTIFALFLALVIGWVMNFVAIIHMDLAFFTGTLAVRLAGVFLPPLGSLLGWFL